MKKTISDFAKSYVELEDSFDNIAFDKGKPQTPSEKRLQDVHRQNLLEALVCHVFAERLADTKQESRNALLREIEKLER